jgi:Rad3-related DNA helicase
MARAVAEALSNGEHLIVEAGTGVGKSLAYLLPSACYALLNRTRVVVSTTTISLQEQLLGQDVPIVRKAIEGWGPRNLGDNLRVAQLKGRRNYLCLLRWANQRRAAALRGGRSSSARLLSGFPPGRRPRRAEPDVRRRTRPQTPERPNEACLASACRYVREGTCFLARARRRADRPTSSSSITPCPLRPGGRRSRASYSYLVVDEAQHLEMSHPAVRLRDLRPDITAFLDRMTSGSAATAATAWPEACVRPAAASPAHGAGERGLAGVPLAQAVERAQRLQTLRAPADFVRHHTSKRATTTSASSEPGHARPARLVDRGGGLRKPGHGPHESRRPWRRSSKLSKAGAGTPGL